MNFNEFIIQENNAIIWGLSVLSLNYLNAARHARGFRKNNALAIKSKLDTNEDYSKTIIKIKKSNSEKERATLTAKAAGIAKKLLTNYEKNAIIDVGRQNAQQA